MNLVALKKRAERYELTKDAGRFFVDDSSSLIKELNKDGKTAWIGIENKCGVYTVIGKDYIYYKTASDERGQLSYNEFLNALENYNKRFGNSRAMSLFWYKHIVLRNGHKVWVHNYNTMGSLWLTILWVLRLPPAP